jgi:RNA polymerase sigma factor (sigma-70 family)
MSDGRPTRGSCDEMFASFCRDGDPQRLAAVFDGTAPELLRVARHLAGDAHAAEDLVQSTFLKAIEHRDRYDPELRVLPWLLGILANTARHERRQALRSPQPAQPAQQSEAASAFDGAVAAESRARLHEALRGLPQPYREVLLLQVEHGLDSAAIAEVKGRKAATVRTQIARGMDLLRGALPAGVGAGVGMAALPSQGSVATAGLVAVRAAVVQHAELVAGANGVAVTAGVVGGGLAMKKVLAVVACLALLLGSGWWFTRDTDSPSPSAPSPAAPIAASAAPQSVSGGTTSEDHAPEAAPRAAPAVATAAGVRVVVRFENGGAASDIGLYVASERLVPFGREATTDIRGVATFTDIPIGDVVVKPDRGPAKSFTVVAGANELELRLPAGVDIEGVVRDARGKAAIPNATIFALSREHHDRAQRLTQADANGVFSLRAVSPGTHLFARAAGWQRGDPGHETVAALAKSPLRVELRVGAHAHALRGRVTTPDGAPAPFAQVAIAVDEHVDRFVGGLRERGSGMQRQRDVDAFLLRADANGEYTTDEVPEGEALVVARPAPRQPPGIALVPVMVAAGADNRCDIVLQPGAELFGTVRDETGEPFASLPLLSEWCGTDRVRFEGAFEYLLACAATTTDANGNYRLSALFAGEHRVIPQASLGASMRVEQHGEQRETVTVLAAEIRRLDLTVARRGDLAVRLLGPGGEPVAGFGIWVEANARPTPRMSNLEAQRTAADGRVRIRGLPRGEALCITAFGPRPKEAGDRLVDRFPAKQWLDVRVRDDELVLHLDANDLPTGVLTGLLVDRHGVTLTATSGWLFRDEWNEKRGFKAPDGSFVHEALAAGRYWLRPSIDKKGRPFLGPFDVAPGERHELGAVVVPEPARLRVRIGAADGKPVTQPRAWLLSSFPDDRNVSLTTDDGALVSSRLTPGRYRLWVAGADLAASTHDVELTDGEERVLHLELPRGFLQPFTVIMSTPVAPTADGWVVDYSLFTTDDVLVQDQKPAALQFSVPLAPGRWTIRWNVPGGPRTSTTFILTADRPALPIALKPD